MPSVVVTAAAVGAGALLLGALGTGGLGSPAPDSGAPRQPNPAVSPGHDCDLMPGDGSSRRVHYADVPEVEGVRLGLARSMLRHAGFANIAVQRDEPEAGGRVNDLDWYVQVQRLYPGHTRNRARDTAIVLSVRSYEKHGCWKPSP